MFYCLSDFHIQDALHKPLYGSAKEKVFVSVLEEANAAGATVVLAGDVIDFTGMTIPNGIESFWSSLGLPATTRPPLPSGRTPAQMLDAVAARFPATFAALTPFATSSRLWVVPGNHDCALRSSAVKVALAKHLGGASASINYLNQGQMGPFLLLAHGQEFDPSNQTSAGCENRGAAITRVLYHAVIPALIALGMPAEVADYIPAVRPEENLVDGLVTYLGTDETNRFLVPFVQILRDNHYWSGLDDVGVWLGEHLDLITPAKVRASLADDNGVKDMVRRGALLLLGSRQVSSPESGFGAIVMGHTHELDWTDEYVNLGTWIDHVRGLSAAEIAAVDRSLPVLVVDDEAGTAELRDYGKDDAPILWVYPPSA